MEREPVQSHDDALTTEDILDHGDELLVQSHRLLRQVDERLRATSDLTPPDGTPSV